MAVFNGNRAFLSKKEQSQPVVPVPKTVRQALNVKQAWDNGIFQIEPKKKQALYDRMYLFEDINYINKNKTEQKSFLVDFMLWLNSMDASFKITFVNEFQQAEEFLRSIRTEKNKAEYPDIASGIRHWQADNLSEMNPNVTTLRYLTVTCRADSEMSARVYLNAMESVIFDAFAGWGSWIVRLDGQERLLALQAMTRPGTPRDKEYLSPINGKRDWRNDILPGSIRQYRNFMVMGDTYISVMFGAKYRKTIDSDSFIRGLSNLSYPSFVTMDFAPVGVETIVDKLNAAQMNNERQIAEELEQKQRAGQMVMHPSYSAKKRKQEIERYMDLIAENDDKGFFLNLLVVLTAPDENTLAKHVEEIRAIGRKEGCLFETCDFRQLKAWNTALPIGGRYVDYMRFFLTSSLVAFQPFHAQDVIEPGGQMLGINKTTKRFIIADRKKLPNPHAIIIGYSGSGKSMLIKLTEVSQTLLGTDDDILILDPQNEFEDICRQYSGAYYDLTPKSGIYLNGFEVSEEVFQSSIETKKEFVAKQTEYAKSVCAAAMKNINVTQEHDSVISRCTERMFESVFEQKHLKKQPTMNWLRDEIKKELENADNQHDEDIIRPIYNSLEEYTVGACDMLAHPTNIEFSENRLVGFGLTNVSENNWEAVMDTILHYLSSRMDYNKKLQKATHLIVDEAQVVSKKPGFAGMLNNAVITFRKFGGVVTMAMQNVTAALSQPMLVELFQNCSYKCFLDQGGVDAHSLAAIQELSAKEFRALGLGNPGEGVMVWNKKVILFDARIKKENPLYQKYSTNFHEKAGDKSLQNVGKPVRIQDTTGTKKEELYESVLKLASVSAVDSQELSSLLNLDEDQCRHILQRMEQKHLIERDAENRYRRRSNED